jgi:hypothetical protein
LFFEDNLDAAIAAIFEDNGVANVDEDDGDLTRFPDTTARDSNEGSWYNVSIFFLPMFAFVTPPFVVDRWLFDFAMIVDVLFWIVIYRTKTMWFEVMLFRNLVPPWKQLLSSTLKRLEKRDIKNSAQHVSMNIDSNLGK